ncbi:MAG: M20/M25/M40 family metallo-hydrolase [Granulicella sp.]
MNRFLCILACGVPLMAASAALPQTSGQTGPSLAETYKADSENLMAAALEDGEGYANLTYLTDHIGKRISGSASLDRAVAWSLELMKKEGLTNVTVQPVMVPKWVRGTESAAIVSPMEKPLHMLGLGMSVGTAPGGVTAEVVVVPSFDALNALGRAGIEGKIVVLNAPYVSYGRTVIYRTVGPSRAAAFGAVGVLVRSITPLAMQIPHTGTLVYQAGVPQIPAAAISLEDAMLLERLTAEGKPVKVHLEMEAHREPDVQSGNVMGELVGSEHPEEMVVVGGHIDSWDVGQGAQDDGSGIMATLAAVAEIKKLGMVPKRTIRVVFWVNEENGEAGGKAYRAMLGDKLSTQVAAIEMDGGAEAPVGYGYGFGRGRMRPAAGTAAVLSPEQQSLELLDQIGTLLEPIGAGKITAGGGGSDIEPMMLDGVPGLGERTTGAHYFDWHHTEADTLDKVDPMDFRKNVASLAVMTWVLADMPVRLAGHVAEPR